MESAFVNIVYYVILCGFFLTGVFTAPLDFVIPLLGFGMVVCIFLDLASIYTPGSPPQRIWGQSLSYTEQ